MRARDWLYASAGLATLVTLASHGPVRPGPKPPTPNSPPPPSRGPDVQDIIRGKDVIRFQTDATGLVLVAPAGANDVTWEYPRVADAKLPRFRMMVERWRDLVVPVSTEQRVPEHVLFGVMWAESGGNPGAVSKAGAQGLFQVMPSHFPPGTTPAEMQEPWTNARAAGKLLRGAYQGFRSLPEVASYYNAGGYPNGSPWTNEAWLKAGRRSDQVSHWGYPCEPGYIDRVVAGSNTYLKHFTGVGT